MDQEKHWNNIAATYEDEIFDVFKSDREGKLLTYFKKHGNKDHTAIDFGCGVGKAFPYLSPLFKHVLGTDISAECIAIAKQRGFSNVSFKRADLTNRRLQFAPAEFAFCCNVIMLPEIDRNLDMIVNIQKALKPGGSAVIILPSLESAIFSAWRLIDWYKKEGVVSSKIPASELSGFKNSKTEILQGLINIDGVTTKHYSDLELQVLVERAGLAITKLDKIEYEWDTEFNAPPEWMKAPYPWDWLIECKKNS
jgi:SAM-dependent methyltransferase